MRLNNSSNMLIISLLMARKHYSIITLSAILV